MMQQQRYRKRALGPVATAIAALGIAALSAGAMAAQPVTAPAAADSHNIQWLGHADLQGRTAYQPTLHTINGRVYLFVGHFSGQTVNGEPNGTYLAVTSVRGSSDAEVDRARASAEGAARRYLDRHPGCAAVGVYHSYPSPGPRRVFVCELRR